MHKHSLAVPVLGAALLAAGPPAPAWGHGERIVAPAGLTAPETRTRHRDLPPLPASLPRWVKSLKNHEVFYKRAPYNFAIYQNPALARDMNGVAVGHAMAYEDLVTGKASELESSTYARIDRVLRNPPALMPAEKSLSPTFARRFGVLEIVFDWTHVAHAQTIDNLVANWTGNEGKDKETASLWRYYQTKGAPFTITGLPMNMAWLDSQAYSGAFRQKYPRVNGLFWGYHWIQTSVYDGLRGRSAAEQKKVYEILGDRYRNVELYNTRRPFMPMMAETSPLFSAKFPEIANGFDNLHMLHDMINDILASEWMTEKQQEEQIERAVYLMSAEAHQNCVAGKNDGVKEGISHDHRFIQGMPGMGLMKTGAENQKDFDPTRLMWMQGSGWMDMTLCHHCSMPLADNGIGDRAWRASTVTAQGWSMRVRCSLCARDMSAETKGRSILTLATEDPHRPLTVFSDEHGALTTLTPEAVFLEETAGHANCSQWSQAFTSLQAFHKFRAANPRFAGAKPLSFEKWAAVEAAGTPDTYEKEKGPVENPYATDMEKRGPAPEVKP